MIFVWYLRHSLFDMVQHDVLTYDICVRLVTFTVLIRTSMWTIIIYDFFVLRITLTVWYGPACEKLVWYLCDTRNTHCLIWSSMWTIIWYLCDMNDTHCLIWSSMWNSFLLRPLVLHRSIRSSSRWLVMMTSWRNFRVWVCIWKFLMRRRNIWGRSDEQAKSPTQTDSEYMTTSLLNQTDERISWLVFASHYSEYTPFRWPSTWSP